jgi:hypothetical protein
MHLQLNQRIFMLDKRTYCKTFRKHEAHTTGNCGFANSPELSQQPRPELLATKLFPNRKILLSGKKSSPTVQNPMTDGKVRLLAKGFFPNNIPVGKEKLLAKPGAAKRYRRRPLRQQLRR